MLRSYGYGQSLASFPGLPRLRFLIACRMQKRSQKLSFCILQAIKNRSRGSGSVFAYCKAIKNQSQGRPANEASQSPYSFEVDFKALIWLVGLGLMLLGQWHISRYNILTNRTNLELWKALRNRSSRLTVYYAQDSTPHLPVTPAQLMRPGIGQNASCAVGGFVQGPRSPYFYLGDVVYCIVHANILEMQNGNIL